MPPRREDIRVTDIAGAIARIKSFTQGLTEESFLKDEKTIDAVIRNFSVIGEAASKLSVKFRKESPRIPWDKMIGMRNFVVHEYFGVSPHLLWATIQKDLPKLEILLEPLLALNQTTSDQSKNKWRPCPPGKHWRKAHFQPTYAHKDGTVVEGHHVSEGCCDNPSKKDQIYSDELNKIATEHFSQLKGPPSANSLDFNDGNKYDEFIRGLTQFWNDVLKPKEPLDANLVKALIASESSFNLNPKVGRNKAHGLMQVTDDSLKILGDKNGELKNHLVHIDQKDILDPNLNIAAGVRWLFQKKHLAISTLKREATWEEAAFNYKGILNKKDDRSLELANRFKNYLKRLNSKK